MKRIYISLRQSIYYIYICSNDTSMTSVAKSESLPPRLADSLCSS